MHKIGYITLIAISMLALLYHTQTPQAATHTLTTFEDFDINSVSCPDTLILFDVDNTLVDYDTPETYSRNLQILLKFPWLIFDWSTLSSKIWKHTTFAIIEPRAVEMINTLKKRGCSVLALTSMVSGSHGIIESMPKWRHQHLKELGITFSEKYKNQTFTQVKQYRGTHPVLYHGILCANKQPKGVVLSAFLEANNLKPKKVIFFDDSLTSIISVENACKKLGIACDAYHYKQPVYPIAPKDMVEFVEKLMR